MSKIDSTPTEKLFGSKTRAKLLNLFFENPEKSFYVREMTRVIDEPKHLTIKYIIQLMLNIHSLSHLLKSFQKRIVHLPAKIS